ncbi:hypothetical protein [Levilactobacillus brevis]|uniref:hypothetical protein n=1 Tax=Levilactobacillus brevis TaxID=1580 RepID=UPI0012E91CA8|nr:hypothetical protein [Levilactobacillus brevis]MUV40498.1 hypothetical protein [Levilactobacillus brevis]
MNIHFIIRHWILSLLFIFLLSTIVSLIMTGILLFFVSKNYSQVAAVGTWTIGGLSLVAGFYYFLFDQKRDIRILQDTKGSQFIIQAFNDSKFGTAIFAKRIYITEKEPNRSKIENAYKKGNSKINFFEITDDFSNFKQYYFLQPHEITPEISISFSDLYSKIAKKSSHNYTDCFLSILFTDTRNENYIFTMHLGENAIKSINSWE